MTQPSDPSAEAQLPDWALEQLPTAQQQAEWEEQVRRFIAGDRTVPIGWWDELVASWHAEDAWHAEAHRDQAV